ncbi:hypothetical protein KUF54_07855 [Comamonas sp. Y33R10-2]|uniref:hypothetical protein n=1 Tax=Comamonas sp. Y33R10-2 TaxID=2853257 RepID=UPI001C5CA18F|nr:hypothetical protein [Comamonas sp. Y33R10-2]QXZ11086.1 hypothetical protein KUF54_07855 [Comamonas sp. Y33R10-2]
MTKSRLGVNADYWIYANVIPECHLSIGHFVQGQCSGFENPQRDNKLADISLSEKDRQRGLVIVKSDLKALFWCRLADSVDGKSSIAAAHS